VLHLTSPYIKSALYFGLTIRLLFACSLLHAGSPANELDYKHGYAFLSDPGLPADFQHFKFVNPDAPKGGRIRIPKMGTWDSFNMLLAKGRVADGLGFWSKGKNLLWDSLMVVGLDEPATYYCQIAEGIFVPEDQAWVAFKLRKEARWHDGNPITVEDVVFTLKTLQEDASVTIRSSFKPFSIEVTGPREFRFHIDPQLRNDASVIFTLGGIPILPKHYWQTHDITRTTLEPPLGSGSYQIGKFAVGRFVEFNRVKDYWGADLAISKGRNNFDVIKYDYFRDDQVQTEAIKANVVDVHDENVPITWHSKYDIPAYDQGFLKKTRIQLLKPSGLWWPIFWNLEQPRFQDIRVRKALWLLGDNVWSGKRSYGFYGHATSFFHESELAATGLPGPYELKYLEPLRDLVPETVFTTAYRPQPNTGKGWSRKNLLAAAALLKEAGWVIEDMKLVHGKTGEPFHIRFVAVSPALAGSFVPFKKNLERLGITASIKAPEISNWLYRMRSGDFDAGAVPFMSTAIPTQHIKNWFTGSEADRDYSQNWSNLKDPAIDALIEAMSNATTWDDYVGAVRAFDRVMLLNYYWRPGMSKTRNSIAYWNKFGFPEDVTLRRMAIEDTWWWDADIAAKTDAFTGGNK